jgi:hypothetical protein
VHPAPVPIVVNQEIAADGRQVAEEVDQRIPLHQ